MTPQPARLAAALLDALLSGFRDWLISLGALFRLQQRLPAASLWPNSAEQRVMMVVPRIPWGA